MNMRSVKSICLFTIIICGFAAYAAVPKIPRGARAVVYVDIKNMMRNEDIRGIMERHVHKGEGLQNEIMEETLAAGEYKAVDWACLVLGGWSNLLGENGKIRVPSLALVISGDFDAKKMLGAVIKGWVESRSVHIVSVPGCGVETYGVSDIDDSKALASVTNVKPIVAAVSNQEVVLASNESMLKAIVAVYVGKEHGVKTYEDMFGHRDCLLSIRVTKLHELIKEVCRIAKPEIPPEAREYIDPYMRAREANLLIATDSVEMGLVLSSAEDALMIKSVLEAFRMHVKDNAVSFKDIPSGVKQLAMHDESKIEVDGNKLTWKFSNLDVLSIIAELMKQSDQEQKTKKVDVADDDSDVEL